MGRDVVKVYRMVGPAGTRECAAGIEAIMIAREMAAAAAPGESVTVFRGIRTDGAVVTESLEPIHVESHQPIA